MKRTSEKSSGRRRRKKASLPSLRIAVLICVLVFIVVAAGALMAPGLRVSEIVCEGCVHLNQADIISAAQISQGENIFIVNTGRARRAIGDIPFVGEVSVKRVFPDKIRIIVSERVPVGYVPHGSEYAVIDSEAMVLELIESGVASRIEEYSTPPEEITSAAAVEHREKQKNDKTDKQDKSEDKSEEDSAAENEGDTQNEGEEQTDGDTAEEDSVEQPDEAVFERPYAVPLIRGLGIKEAECGRTVKSEDGEKLDSVLNICRALDAAELLGRATYLDVEDGAEVRLIIENRLDVRLGKPENMEYRARFLAEVINTKISAYENLIMDYHGADIYVRSPEDGKDRIVKKSGNSEEDEEDNEDSEDNNDIDADSDTEYDSGDENEGGDASAERETSTRQSSMIA